MKQNAAVIGSPVNHSCVTSIEGKMAKITGEIDLKLEL